MTLHEVAVEIPVALFDHQWDLLQYDPDRGRGPTIEALLGWWSVAKTTGGAAKFTRRVFQCPRTAAYGDDPEVMPKSTVIGPTMRTVERAIMPKLREVLPRELVTREWQRPIPRWRLVNGHEIAFVSAESDFEGEDLCNIWADEFHRPQYASGTLWNNMQARLRDKYAPVLSLILTGLPEAGFVRDRLDVDLMTPEESVNRFLRLAGTDDNPTLDEEFVRQLLARVPFGARDAVLRGGWMLQPGAVFSGYDQGRHILPDTEEDPNAPVHLSLDVGNHSAAVLGQDRPCQVRGITGQSSRSIGLLVVDEVLGEGWSTEDLCRAVKLTPSGHRIVPGRSTIYADPTMRRDEQLAVQRNFPGVHFELRPRTDDFYEIEPGIRHLQAMLRDGLDNTRLWFASRLKHNRNGVLEALLDARRSPRSGALVKNDRTDHARDALRYLVQGRLGTLGGFEPSVS